MRTLLLAVAGTVGLMAAVIVGGGMLVGTFATVMGALGALLDRLRWLAVSLRITLLVLAVVAAAMPINITRALLCTFFVAAFAVTFADGRARHPERAPSSAKSGPTPALHAF